jgi:hypothetical protein
MTEQQISELKILLTDIAQIFDGWHADGTVWSEWDESVRRRVSEVLKSLEDKGEDKGDETNTRSDVGFTSRDQWQDSYLPRMQ